MPLEMAIIYITAARKKNTEKNNTILYFEHSQKYVIGGERTVITTIYIVQYFRYIQGLHQRKGEGYMEF